MEEWLTDPEAPWWAKLRRASVHIEEARRCVAELESGEAWSIEREPADADGWEYRFRIHRAVPADLSAAVGDAVANMRAALDYVAYELARHHVAEMGNEMGDKEEAVTSFPICIDEATFEQFFAPGKKGGNIRSRLYGGVERKALRCVQPFALAAEAREVGVEPSTDARDDLLTDDPYVLNTIWNIDKHRRLPKLAWAIDDLVWWSRADVAYRWVGPVKKLASLQDGAMLGELHGPAGAGRPQTDACFDVHLVLCDDPSPYASPLVARLESLHQSLVGWVLPRIFMVANGKYPPIMISFSAPT
jgi:hypothetical protein